MDIKKTITNNSKLIATAITVIGACYTFVSSIQSDILSIKQTIISQKDKNDKNYEDHKDIKHRICQSEIYIARNEERIQCQKEINNFMLTCLKK